MEINFTYLTLPVVCGVVSPLKAAGDNLLMNKFIRQNFGGGLTLKNVIS